MKACETCGKRFEPAKPWARFCSDVCRVQRFRARERSQKPGAELERALLSALREVRAGKDAAKVAAKLQGELDAIVSKRVETKADPRQIAMFSEGEKLQAATHARAKARPIRQALTLEQRFRKAREAGATALEFAREIGLRDGTALSKWQKGGALSPEKRERLGEALARRGF